MKTLSFILTLILIIITIYQWITPSKKDTLNHEITELYNKELNFINTLNDFSLHADSIAIQQFVINRENKIVDSVRYVLIIDSLVKDRFYHAGFSYYSFQDNYIAYLMGKYIWQDLSAIVIPNDILKYNYAACSQQAIVFQELLKKKKYNVRKVGFNSSVSGHFCSEVKYNNENHFFDTNLEANWKSIENIPSTQQLVTNKEVLKQVYSHLEKRKLKVFTEKEPFYGKWNEFPAKKIRLFHIITFTLSNISFLITGTIYLFVQKKSK